jgi:hypothetical protein
MKYILNAQAYLMASILQQHHLSWKHNNPIYTCKGVLKCAHGPSMDIFHMDLTFNLLTSNLILENKTTKTNKQKTLKSTIFEQYNGYLKTNLYA